MKTYEMKTFDAKGVFMTVLNKTLRDFSAKHFLRFYNPKSKVPSLIKTIPDKTCCRWKTLGCIRTEAALT